MVNTYCVPTVFPKKKKNEAQKDQLAKGLKSTNDRAELEQTLYFIQHHVDSLIKKLCEITIWTLKYEK